MVTHRMLAKTLIHFVPRMNFITKEMNKQTDISINIKQKNAMQPHISVKQWHLNVSDTSTFSPRSIILTVKQSDCVILR